MTFAWGILMATTPEGLAELKQRLRATWMAGDFGQIARLNAHEGDGFVDRLQLKPGTKLLDVACGTGNLAIPAAQAGAVVIGLDIAPNLLQQARERAEAEGLKIEFVEGDAEKLPYPDGKFDAVVSMFGAMFAPRPGVVALELKRVCRSGGLIAMANWTPEGFVGQMFQIMARHVPPQPGMFPPALWGVEKVVAERLGSEVKLQTSRQLLLFDYPFSAADTVEFFRKYFGPIQTAFQRLDETAQKSLTEDLIAHWVKNNQGDANHTAIKAEYLEVHGTLI
jgi:ubiquinone/menaquinone biosynthesis C-methylase UbiE